MTINLEELGNQPIPEVAPVAGWKEVPLAAGDEPLVALGLLGQYPIFTSSIYYGEHKNSPYSKLPGSLLTVFVRQSVAEQLVRAEQLLPIGYHLIVFDAYRPLEVQQSLYDTYYNALKTTYPSWSEDELATETQRYVSLPSNNPQRPSPHNTGGSVDLAIMKLPDAVSERLRNLPAGSDEQTVVQLTNDVLTSAEMLDFGTAFDWGQSEAALRYLEDLHVQGLLGNAGEALRNRRKLYHLMREVGLEAYTDEWWHYNSAKTQMGAKTAGAERAELGAATLSEDNKAHELRRQKLATEVTRKTSLPMAAVIKPVNK